MADDRPIEAPEEHAARIERELNEFKAVMTARLTRRPTGDVEATIRTTPKDNTLLCDGSLVSRETYAGLWQWAQDQGLVTGNLFTTGNGTTTFRLPDFRGRVLVMSGTLGTDTYSVGQVFGSSTVKLATEHMPAHSHPVSSDSHSHGTNNAGGHGAHRPGEAPGVGGSGARWPTVASSSGGDHSHGTSSDSHSHTTSVIGGSFGNDTTSGRLENRQASVAVNYLIWI